MISDLALAASLGHAGLGLGVMLGLHRGGNALSPSSRDGLFAGTVGCHLVVGHEMRLLAWWDRVVALATDPCRAVSGS